MARYFVRYATKFNTRTTLVNIFLCELFLVVTNIDFASYADDNTPYTTDENAAKVIDQLEKEAKSLFN